jgi:hypothetical protein
MSPVSAYHWRPLTFISTTLISLWMLWFGVYLVALPFPLRRYGAYSGPEQLLSLREWGAAFLIGSVLMATRLFFLDRTLGFLMQLTAMMVVVGWAGAWFAGPLTLAQPAYTLIAVLTVGLPFIHRLVPIRFRSARSRVSPGRTDTVHTMAVCTSAPSSSSSAVSSSVSLSYASPPSPTVVHV